MSHFRRIFQNKPAQNKSVKVQQYHDWTRQQPCVVTGNYGVQIHHVTATAREGGRFTRSHWNIVPLSPQLHQHDLGEMSVERLGHDGFFRAHGVDLEVAAYWNLLKFLEEENL